MDTEFKDRFLQNWARYFPGAELPIGFYYSNSAEPIFMARPPKGHRCIIGDIAKVRKGKTLCFDIHTIGCNGGKRYLMDSDGTLIVFHGRLTGGSALTEFLAERQGKADKK